MERLFSGDDKQAEAASVTNPNDHKAAMAAIEKQLASAEIERRWWTCKTLAAIEAPEAGDLLARALADEDLSVQLCAAKSLEVNPQLGSQPALILALDSYESLLRRLAGNALAALGQQGTQGLIAAFHKLSLPGQIECVRALSLIKDPASISFLFGLLESDSQMVRYWAEEGLDAMGLGMRFFAPD